MHLSRHIAASVTQRAIAQVAVLAEHETWGQPQHGPASKSGVDGWLRGRRDEKRAGMAAATLLATAAGAVPGVAAAAVTTVTTTQQYGPAASFDVLFPAVASATELTSISVGSVYTGEAAQLTIEAIASDNTILPLFDNTDVQPYLSTEALASITNNSFSSFSAQDIVGLRFSWSSGVAQPPTIELPLGTEFVFVAVPEPAVGVMLACSLAVVCFGHRIKRLVSARAPR